MARYLIVGHGYCPDEIFDQELNPLRPIHVAAMYGSLMVLQYLISEHQVDATVKEKFGYDALSLAIRYKQLHVAQWLVDEDLFDITTTNLKGGKSYFSLAMEHKLYRVAASIKTDLEKRYPSRAK